MDNQEQLVAAAKEGNLNEVVRLIPLTNPQRDYSEALGQAARYGHLDCVQVLIPVSYPAADASFALWIAALNGHIDCVEALLPVSNPNDDNCRALKIAARNGHLECVALLMPYARARDRMGALKSAIVGEHVNCVTLLLKRSPDSFEFYSAFSAALERGNNQILDAMYPVAKNKKSLFGDSEYSHPANYCAARDEFLARKQNETLLKQVKKSGVRSARKM